MNLTKFFFIIVVFLLLSCKQKINTIKYESKHITEYYLTIIDSIKYYYEKDNFIGKIGYSNAWKDYFIFTDTKQKKVFIFDKDFNLIKSLGRIGRGPGEYENSPQIILGADSLILFDPQQKLLNYYDENFNLVEVKKIDSKFIYQYAPALEIEGRFVFSISFPEEITNPEYYKNYNSLIWLDNKLKYVDNFFKWDQIYLDVSTFSYACHNFGVLMVATESNNFFALQKASDIIYKFNSALTVDTLFGTKPKYFRQPPEGITPKEIQKSFDTAIKYFAQITTKGKIDYDNSNHLLMVEYRNTIKENYVKLNSFLGGRYLQIYNKDFNLIYDDVINGIFLFPYNGKIYLLEEEATDYFLIKIYELTEK